MAEYLPPIHISEVFNVDDYTYQDGFIIYKEADHRYLRPIQRLQQKTTGISYNELNSTTNVSENINITKLMNSSNGAIRDNMAVSESVAIGSNLVVGKNIVNSGDIYTNNIIAKSISIKDAVFKNILIDDTPINSTSIRFIRNLSSDVQLQLDTNSKKIGPAGKDGLDGSPGTNGLDGSSGTNGTNGLDGSSGTNGTNGLDGSPGTNGLDDSPGSMAVD